MSLSSLGWTTLCVWCIYVSTVCKRRKKEFLAKTLPRIRPRIRPVSGRIQGRICRGKRKKNWFWLRVAIRPKQSGQLPAGFPAGLTGEFRPLWGLASASYPAENPAGYPARFWPDSDVAGHCSSAAKFSFSVFWSDGSARALYILVQWYYCSNNTLRGKMFILSSFLLWIKSDLIVLRPVVPARAGQAVRQPLRFALGEDGVVTSGIRA